MSAGSIPSFDTVGEFRHASLWARVPDAVQAVRSATCRSTRPALLPASQTVDSGLLVTGPAQTVHEQTRDLLTNCRAEGGLILGASNAVFHETPIEHYLAMNRAWKEFGRY